MSLETTGAASLEITGLPLKVALVGSVDFEARKPKPINIAITMTPIETIKTPRIALPSTPGAEIKK